MRYFRYKNTGETEMAAMKAQYTSFTAQEKRLFRKEKFLSKLTNVLFFAISIAFFIVFGFLISLIPEPESVWLSILSAIAEVVLWIGSLIVSLLIGGLIMMPFWDKIDTSHRAVKREILSKACAHLREYYELQEPCLVTKCYDSSDHKFVDHDVCLFVVRDELRITTNLKHGFFHGDKDLGCYVLDREEITVSEAVWDGHKATELKAGEVRFLLCFRGGRFVEKWLLEKTVQRAEESDE